MKYLLVLTLFAILLAGCTPAADYAKATPLATTEDNKSAVVTEATVTAGVATPNMTSSPGGITIDIKPTPSVIESTQNATIAPHATSTPLGRAGWQTFNSSTLEISVEYPPGWMAAEDTDGVTFTSPQGDAIVFSPIGANNDETMVGNQHCTTRTNSYNLTAEVCAETVSFSYSAKFALPASDGSTRQIMMKTITRATMLFFEAMFDSVHPLK